MNNVKKLSIHELINQTREYLLTLGYHKRTMRDFESNWAQLLDFSKSCEADFFNLEFGYKFLLEKFNIEPFKSYPSNLQSIRRSIIILSDFQLYGFINKKQPTKNHFWHDEYKDACGKFMCIIAEKVAVSTLRQYRTNLEKFTSYLKSNLVIWDTLNASHIEGYLNTYLGYAKSTLCYCCYVLKGFLHYLYESNLTLQDLSEQIPNIKFNNRSNLPSVFSKDEISKILSAIDRGSPQGKRDYAIFLLAIHYGMRVGDIRNLKLNDLNFETNKIVFTQNKTQTIVELNMLTHVGWALIDYLKNARPLTSSNNVFIRLIAPYDAFGNNNNLGNLMKKYLLRAGIKQTKDRHYGMHTFRHSLASHLIDQGTPIHVISKVLGHSELNSTMIYTKINLKQLELLTLEVPHDTKTI